MMTPNKARPTTELDEIVRIIQQMGGMCEENLANAVESIARRDDEMAQEIITNDVLIDRLEREIERLASRYISTATPQGFNLRMVMSGLKVAADLERVGDLAKNISKRALVMNREKPLPNRISQGIARMGAEAGRQLTNVLDAFTEQDADRAMAVWRRDEAVDELTNSLFTELLTDMVGDPLMVSRGTHLMFVAKNLERAADHATNIAETIHYFVTGDYVGEARPKGDLTSLTGVSFEKPS
jgi:phosphate transport system protein